MNPEPEERKEKRQGLHPTAKEPEGVEESEAVGMQPSPGRSTMRGPVEDPRMKADLEPQGRVSKSGTYPLTESEGRLAGQRGHQNPDHVGPAKGPAGEETEETQEADAGSGVRP